MKKAFVYFIVLMCFFSITGCKSKKVSSPFNQETVANSVTSTIELFNNNERYKFFDLCTHNLRSSLNNKKLDDMFYLLSDAGDVEEIKIKEMSSLENTATVKATAKFTEKKLTYTMSFSPDMKLTDFSVEE